LFKIPSSATAPSCANLSEHNQGGSQGDLHGTRTCPWLDYRTKHILWMYFLESV